jgi:hypothetical protein
LHGASPAAEVLPDRGQGDVHDPDIEHDHELRRAQQYEDNSFMGVSHVQCLSVYSSPSRRGGVVGGVDTARREN